MDWLNELDQWLQWLWNWIDWLWAGAWVVAGILATHLLWWRRHTHLAEREKTVQDQLVRIDSRQREIRRQTEEMTRREGSLRKMEESLRQQTEQLMPQIEQVRGWLEQTTGRPPVPEDRGKEKPAPSPGQRAAPASPLH